MRLLLASLALLALAACTNPRVTLEKGCCTFTTTVTAPVNPPDLKDVLPAAPQPRWPW